MTSTQSVSKWCKYLRQLCAPYEVSAGYEAMMQWNQWKSYRIVSPLERTYGGSFSLPITNSQRSSIGFKFPFLFLMCSSLLPTYYFSAKLNSNPPSLVSKAKFVTKNASDLSDECLHPSEQPHKSRKSSDYNLYKGSRKVWVRSPLQTCVNSTLCDSYLILISRVDSLLNNFMFCVMNFPTADSVQNVATFLWTWKLLSEKPICSWFTMSL